MRYAFALTGVFQWVLLTTLPFQVLLRVSSKKYEVLGMNEMTSLLAWLDSYEEQRAQTIKNGVKDEKVAGREQGGSYDLSCMLMVHLRKQQVASVSFI